MRKLKKKLGQYSYWILAASILGGAVLRWLHIDADGFWYDEAISTLVSRLSAVQIITNRADDVHPFGYYLLLHFWTMLGQSEFTIRSLSAIFSLGAIPMIYGLGMWLFDRQTATIAAVGMAFAPFQVYFAREARMYGVLIFLITALIWLFLYAVKTKGSRVVWAGYVLVSILLLHLHYFSAFLIIGLHLWVVIRLGQNRAVVRPLLLSDVIITLLFLPQAGQALTETGLYLTTASWQASPSLLSPLTTIYYLLFAHRSPFWIFPFAMFLLLTGLILIAWEGRRRSGWADELALWLALLSPIAIVIVVSWLIEPIYVERSFAVGTPALILLLARGMIAAPTLSPTPYIIGLLAIPIAITLTADITTLDPAKPPVREAVYMIADGFTAGDVVLHLQDPSYMPALWYAPQIPHKLANVPGALLITIYTHQVFGGDVVQWQSALIGADRLWLTVMPGYIGVEQTAVFDTINDTYPLLMMKDWGAVQLYLYDLRGKKQ